MKNSKSFLVIGAFALAISAAFASQSLGDRDGYKFNTQTSSCEIVGDCGTDGSSTCTLSSQTVYKLNTSVTPNTCTVPQTRNF